MRHTLIVILCIIGIHAYAFNYAPFSAPKQTPAARMHSVNDITYMSSGSSYSPSVYEIDMTNDQPARSIRRAGGPGGTDNTGYDPSNPQFSPIGDAVIPLLIMALIYMIVAYRRKTKVSDLCI